MPKRKVILSILILLILFFSIYLLYYLNYLPHKKYTNKDFGIETYKSQVDKDNDSLDDQTDILKNTRTYIATKPKYKSKYYETGYSNDNYGVCTDVVAFALLNAGYDLKELVNEDIKNNKELYSIPVIDKNIDFRRVKNLKIYFAHNAIPLTTDITDISAWQGGDIVIFEKHIGIVSDKRNKKGINFIIHHANSMQLNYEEDVLEHYGNIVGHYRVS